MVRVTTNLALQHCAVAKQNSDGSGPNVIPAVCGTAVLQQTPCTTTVHGYPKGTNSTNTAMYMAGIKWWNNCIS